MIRQRMMVPFLTAPSEALVATKSLPMIGGRISSDSGALPLRSLETILDPLDRRQEFIKGGHDLVPLARGHPGSDGADQLVPPSQEVLKDRHIHRNQRGNG